MKRSLLITFILGTLLLGGAGLVYQRLFSMPTSQMSLGRGESGRGESGRGESGRGESGQRAHLAKNTSGVSSVKGSRKGVGTTDAQHAPKSAAIDGGTALLALNSQHFVVNDGGTAAQAFRAKVLNVRGRVESRAADGSWQNIESGTFLDIADAVRTGRSGEANLAMGNGVKVRLSPRSEFNIQELKEGLSQIELAEGHVTASVDPDGKQILQVSARGSDAMVQSGGGEFGVVTDGRGQVAVATVKGSVRFTSRGKTVRVLAGNQSAVVKGSQGPSAPTMIPRSLLLKASPAQVKTNRSSTVVEGKTQAGALVRVDGVLTPTDSRGRFRRRVPLKEGVNRVRVEVLSATGQMRQKKLPPVLLDRKKPTINANMQWGSGG